MDDPDDKIDFTGPGLLDWFVILVTLIGLTAVAALVFMVIEIAWLS